jgi:hypothetical protein
VKFSANKFLVIDYSPADLDDELCSFIELPAHHYARIIAMPVAEIAPVNQCSHLSTRKC